MKKAFLLLLLVLLVLRCAAQETCNLESKDAPTFFGFRLGMTQQETQIVFGKDVKFKVKKSGKRSFFQNFIEKPPPDFLTGVRALYLRFDKNMLYQIEIFYEEKDDRQTLEEFIGELSKAHKLSESLWQNVKGRTELKCAGFTLVADKVLNPRIELTEISSQ